MIRTLLKKQLTEIFRSYFYNFKKNRARSKAGIIGMFILFILLMLGVIGGMFGFLSYALCSPLSAARVEWLYFLILGMLAIVFGTFGSVFNTYSGLYLSKDNDLLLSMPVPVRAILVSRLLGVYLMGLMYSSMVCLPALIVYWITVGPTLQNVACGLVWFLGITIFILVLSCVLGWAVARISVKLKNRSFVTVLLALVFIVLYYVVYFKAQELVRDLLQNAVVYGEKIKGSAWVLYAFGQSAVNWLYMAGFLALVLALFTVTCLVLNRSFLKIVSASRTVAKVRYREKAAKLRSLPAALLHRELTHFTSSPNYMLNCGLGIVLLPAMGILILAIGSDIQEIIQHGIGPAAARFIPVVACAAMGSICSMVDTTPPSVSLEGKSLWLIQSLPVDPWMALQAKLRMQLLLGVVPVLFCACCIAFLLAQSLLQGILIVLFALVTLFFYAAFGLLMSVKMPNLTWTNEAIPVKQSGAVAVAMLGGMAWAIVFGAVYFLVEMDPTLYIAIGLAVELALGLACYFWLRKKGAARFAQL